MQSKTALIIIDVQEGLDDPRLGARNNPDAESRMARLLGEWRRRQRPVFHIQHMSAAADSPLRPGQPGNAIKSIVAPRGDEAVIQKTANSAFIGTDLEERLKAVGARKLVIVGLTTDHCVSATTRMAGDMGYETIIVADATAAHERRGYDGAHYPAETVHALALASLHGEFATVLNTEQALAPHRDEG